MENRIALKILIFLAILLLSPSGALAYRDNPHRLLTDEAVKFFNKNYPALAIGETDKNSVVQGGVDEDYPNADFRYLRHFYDPVRHAGFSALGKTWESSKDWSKDTIEQATVSLPNALDASLYGNVKDWFSGADDYSWERAVYEYAWGDKKRGLEALGHILHLAEDLNVPEHTRNDSHPNFVESWSVADGSPY